MDKQLIHATCVALEGPGGPCGVLLRGPSGSGKSDLALRLIDQGARLVADDQCELSARAPARIVARAPAVLAGRIEARGLGIVEAPRLAEVSVALIVDLVPGDTVERLPEPAEETILGVALPRIALDPFEASTPAKLRLALAPAVQNPSAQDAAAQDVSAGSPDGERRRVILVTGMSGAGHSTALKALEDMGYETIDNLPLSLLDAVLSEAGAVRPLAVGVDTRTRRFAAQNVVRQLRALSANPDLAVTLLILDCQDDVLARRFTETRRRHPLARDRQVADGIAAERALIAPLKAHADLVLDTSALPPAELGRVMAGHFGLGEGTGMAVFVTSFSFRHGLPREADLVFDVRFLANPHYDPTLRPLDGRDPRVAAYIEQDPEFEGFFGRLIDMLAPLLPRYEAEGKSYLTIAVGCTGGRHRSVLVAERLGVWLRAGGRPAEIGHRDLGPADPPCRAARRVIRG